jgi:hypothetical protein
MRHWPWIAIVVTAVLALSPPGMDVFHAAFLSGEALSRGIWRPIYLTGLGLLFALGLIEWYVRRRLERRRAQKTAAAARTET